MCHHTDLYIRKPLWFYSVVVDILILIGQIVLIYFV